VELATLEGRDLHFGLNPFPGRRHAASERHIPQIERLVEELDRARPADSESRELPLYRQFPEAWLESQARAHLDVIDASLEPDRSMGKSPPLRAASAASSIFWR
jgi:hypothetical protein